MAHDGVFACAKEGLDLEILLDPFEEELHRPTFLVNIGNRLGFQLEGLGEEELRMPRFRVQVVDEPKRNGAVLGLCSRKLNRLIRGYTISSVHLAALQDFAGYSLLHPGEEERAIRKQVYG